MNTRHHKKKPSPGSTNWHIQQDIAPQYPRLDSSGSNTNINQPQNIYIHQHQTHTTTTSHRHKKTRSDYPNIHGQQNIAPQYPRRDNPGSNVKIKDRRNSYVSDDNGQYHKGRFYHSHLSYKRQHWWSHDSCQLDEMNVIEYWVQWVTQSLTDSKTLKPMANQLQTNDSAKVQENWHE